MHDGGVLLVLVLYVCWLLCVVGVGVAVVLVF